MFHGSSALQHASGALGHGLVQMNGKINNGEAAASIRGSRILARLGFKVTVLR